MLVAAGGGGLGLGRFIDDDDQHGQGPLIGRATGAGITTRKDAGTSIIVNLG